MKAETRQRILQVCSRVNHSFGDYEDAAIRDLFALMVSLPQEEWPEGIFAKTVAYPDIGNPPSGMVSLEQTPPASTYTLTCGIAGGERKA